MLHNKEILIVEDDPVFSRMIASFLEREGAAVREVENGLEGLQALRQSIPDLLISDLSMPVMTGLEFVEEVSLEYPMLPMIVISGTGGMADVAQALRFGVKDFLIKPIEDINVVKKAIEAVVDDANDDVHASDDFSQQWFKVSEDTDRGASETELKWHLDALRHNPGSARELLMGLMPEPDSQQGAWRLSYHSLQSADANPIVLDYAWLMGGKMAFYVVDSASAEEDGTATTLMIRAFFNDFVRSGDVNERGFLTLVKRIEDAIRSSAYTSPVRAMFGVLNTTDNQLDILPAGIKATVDSCGATSLVHSDHWLGRDAFSSQFQSVDLQSGDARVSLNEVGLNSFSVDIQKIA
ncbi:MULTISPECIES: response regulator [unclassified Salinivibrio]|uniref:response regulator n=1 Tax=unclassified Salinivibrio TaxID=2636825 RepID=UPI0006146AC8|nr:MULTISPECIES: response regulator [unclassified Salinivibrio]KKA43969.1 chemotaxis protein CheY [Salinivibrio sp. KP-1]OOE73907.1 response regulator [Salinivibrio sp. ML290]